MKIEGIKTKEDLPNISEIESGTLVKYKTTDDIYEDYGYGIVIKDCDNENTIIYDLENDMYFSDYENYVVYEELKAKIVVEDYEH